MTMDAINPPPLPRASSEPPQVRAERVRWDAIENIVTIIAASVLCYLHVITPEVWGPIVAASSFGAGVLRVMGAKRAGVASIALLGVAKVLGASMVGATRYLLVALALVLAFAFGGCAGDPALEQVRAPVNVLGERLAVLHRGLHAMCLPPESVEPPPPAECSEVMQAYNDVAQAQRVAQTALDVIEATR